MQAARVDALRMALVVVILVSVLVMLVPCAVRTMDLVVRAHRACTSRQTLPL